MLTHPSAHLDALVSRGSCDAGQANARDDCCDTPADCWRLCQCTSLENLRTLACSLCVQAALWLARLSYYALVPLPCSRSVSLLYVFCTGVPASLQYCVSACARSVLPYPRCHSTADADQHEQVLTTDTELHHRLQNSLTSPTRRSRVNTLQASHHWYTTKTVHPNVTQNMNSRLTSPQRCEIRTAGFDRPVRHGSILTASHSLNHSAVCSVQNCALSVCARMKHMQGPSHSDQSLDHPA